MTKCTKLLQAQAQNPRYFVDHALLASLIAGRAGPYRLFDARCAAEYAGRHTGYDYIDRAGRIPTAESIINGDYQLSAMQPLAVVLKRLEQTLKTFSVGRADRIIWYCGTAWRASRMALLTRAAGFTHVVVYNGGWNEWQRLQ